jgi:serpin B
VGSGAGHVGRVGVTVLVAIVAASCGSGERSIDRIAPDTTDTSTPETTEPETTMPDPTAPDPTAPGTVTPDGAAPMPRPIAVPARLPAAASPAMAGAATTALGFDVLREASAVAGDGDNVVVSPTSIAVALGLLEPGSVDVARQQLRDLLRIDDPAAWHASMSALEQSLEARVAELPYADPSGDQDPGEIHVNVADAAFVRPGYPLRADYLDLIGTTYGAVLEELDFRADQAAAADRINGFVAAATDDRITDLVRATDIDPDAVLVLVDALLLRASWQHEFDPAATVDDDFTRVDGSTVEVPLMSGRGDASGRGDGWVAATKQLVGNVRLEVVLPDAGRFDEIAGRLDEVLDAYGRSATAGAELVMPRFETRVTVPLTEVLQRLGLLAVFEEGGLLGIADDPALQLDRALHQTFLSIDETGIEAAAATVVIAIATSAPVDEPVPVVLDRPFLFRIVDGGSDATLFVGRVMDPTA